MKKARETRAAIRPKRRKPEISPEDHALWVHVTRSAKPLPGRAPLPLAEGSTEVPAPEPGKTAVPPPMPPRARSMPPLAGIEKNLARQVSRGQIGFDARIDLHGMRQAEAHAALLAFIHRAHHTGARIVLVITGKGIAGKGSPDPGPLGDERGVLRRMVPHWLADPGLRSLVIGFDSAARAHGGDGALYVRIRRRRGLA